MKSTLLALALGFLGCLGLASCSKEPKPAGACLDDAFGCAVFDQGATVKLGYGGPMTGDSAIFGTDLTQAARIAIDEANGQGVEGWKFELSIGDDMGTPEGGATVANLFVSDKNVVAVIGHTFSGATDAAIPIYGTAGYPMLSPSATNPALTKTGSKVFNRIAFSDDEQGKEAAAYLYAKLKFRRLAVIHDGGAFGQGLASVVRQEFTQLGGEVTLFEAITPGETDYSALLAVASTKTPDALYFGGYAAEAAVLVSQMRAAGLKDVVFFSCDGIFGTQFMQLAGKASEGTYATSIIPPLSPERSKFDDGYKAAYGIEAGKLSAYTWNAYDCTAALVHAVRQVAYVKDNKLYIPRGALIQAVRSLKDFPGLTGKITCRADGECNTSERSFYVVRNAEWIEAP